VAFVQGNAGTSSGASTTLNFTSAVGAGNFLVAVARTSGSPAVSDNQDGAWTEMPVPNAYTSVWYVANAKGGPTTVTLAGASGALRIAIGEYSGVAAASPFDAGTCLGGTGPAVTTGNTGTVAAGDLVVAGWLRATTRSR
jgi:hypothetical protein